MVSSVIQTLQKFTLGLKIMCKLVYVHHPVGTKSLMWFCGIYLISLLICVQPLVKGWTVEGIIFSKWHQFYFPGKCNYENNEITNMYDSNFLGIF